MTDVNDIKALIRSAMQKEASAVDSVRNDENEKDVKDNIPASVDSQTAADATGIAAEAPEMNIGTKGEATTDAKVDGLPKETNDDQAFKSASELQKLASTIIESITKAAETANAISVEAAEGGIVADSKDAVGKEEAIAPSTEAGGEAAQDDKSTVQTSATKVEEVSASVTPQADPAEGVVTKQAGELAQEIYQLAAACGQDEQGFTKAASEMGLEDVDAEISEGDVDGLGNDEADELAAALQASAMDAAGEGQEDANNVADYLEAYQAAPEALGEAGGEVAPEMGGGDEIAQLLEVLEQAGIGPEELQAALEQGGGAPEAMAPEAAPVMPGAAPVMPEEPIKMASFESMNTEDRRKVILDVLKNVK